MIGRTAGLNSADSSAASRGIGQGDAEVALGLRRRGMREEEKREKCGEDRSAEMAHDDGPLEWMTAGDRVRHRTTVQARDVKEKTITIWRHSRNS